MTENVNLSKGLLARVLEAEERQGAGEESSLMFGSTVSSIENGVDNPDGLNLLAWPVVSVSSSKHAESLRIAARLLVGADGANSPVRTFAGIPSKGWDYNRHGVVATLNIENQLDGDIDSFFSSEPLRTTAYQRFLPALGGPIALLPLPDGKASLVWSTTPKIAAYLKSLSLETLATMINAAFRLSMTDISYMLTLPPHPPVSSSSSQTYTHADELTWRLQHTPIPPHIPTPPLVTSIQPSTVASFPLRFRQSSSYTSPRIALIGDAAHSIHPLAGQGLNLGLGDARVLSRTIEEAVLMGQDLGDAMIVLSRYGAERWGKGVAVGGVCDLLNRVYGVDGGLVGWGRGLGVRVVDALPGLKGWVMGRAERA